MKHSGHYSWDGQVNLCNALCWRWNSSEVMHMSLFRNKISLLHLEPINSNPELQFYKRKSSICFVTACHSPPSFPSNGCFYCLLSLCTILEIDALIPPEDFSRFLSHSFLCLIFAYRPKYVIRNKKCSINKLDIMPHKSFEEKSKCISLMSLKYCWDQLNLMI